MRFRIFVFLFLLTTVFVFSQQAEQTEADWFIGKPIKDIVFSGIKNVALNELDALVNPYKGQIYDENIYVEILTKLFAIGYFTNIEAETIRADTSGSEVILRFTVTENPVIGRITFTGNSGLRRSALMDAVSVKIGDFYNPAGINADIEAIKNKYTEEGFPNAQVQVNEITSSDSSITLVFNISEGDKITIGSIEFQGNTRFSVNALKGQLSLKTKGFLRDGAFQEAKLLEDIKAIETYYHDRGFVDAVVMDVTRTFENDDKSASMTLTFMIEEGELFTFGGITFEGNVIFTSAQLEKLVNSKVADTVNFTRLTADLQRIADLYFENGYIFNTIERNESRDNETNVLSYHVFIVERGRAYIENIIVRGNDKTKTDVILREIPLESGDVFSKTKVMDAMRNLYNLQFFSTIMPDTLMGSSENLMDLVFTVEEAPTTDVQFGLTFSGSADPDTFPISGLISWNDRNLAGTGNQIGVELNSSVIDTTSFSINYLHRWIFGLPLSGGVDFSVDHSRRLAAMNNAGPIFNGDETYAYPDGFHSWDEYVDNNRLPPRDYLMEYNEFHISLGFNTGYRWNTPLGILGTSGGFRFGIVKNIYDYNLYRPFDPALRERNNEWIPINSLWFLGSLDQRDIFYDPSSGYFASNRMGFFGIFNNDREHYIRNDTKLQYYLTLFDIPVTEKWHFKSVLAIQGGLSFIFKQPGRDLVVIDSNELSVDGMFVGRGWSDEFRNKGLLLLDNWVELRFPLFPGILAFDLFFDAVGVESTQGYYFGKDTRGNSNFTIDNMRFSYGGGLRFTMPQFPFRMSLAKRFRFEDEKFKWEPGALFGDSKNPALGMDFVISFVLSQ